MNGKGDASEATLRSKWSYGVAKGTIVVMATGDEVFDKDTPWPATERIH